MEDKIIEMQETKEVVETTKKSSKVAGAIRKVGSGIKKNWKPVVAGAVALVVGYTIGSKKSGNVECSDEYIDEPTSESVEEETVE